MTTLNKLLDKAATKCSPSNGEGLGRRLGLSRSAVSKWRTGGAISEKHLAALIDLAGENPALAVQVLAEQATTRQEKAVWGSLQQRLGLAAMHIMSTVSRLYRRAPPALMAC